MACDGENPGAPSLYRGFSPYTQLVMPDGEEWASYPHPVHYIDMTGNSKKTISGVGAVIGHVKMKDPPAPGQDAINVEFRSCAHVKTVLLRYTETQDNGPFADPTDTPHPAEADYNSTKADNPRKPPKHYFRCAH